MPNNSAAEAIVKQSTLVLDCLPRAIVAVDLDGVIVGWNQVAERFYGWTAAEALGKSLYELITPAELNDAGRRIMSNVLAGERWSGDIRAVRRDGSMATTFSFLGPLRDQRGHIIGAIAAADETAELVRLKQETSDLTDHLLLALAAGELGTWRWDMASGTTTWDEATERLFGLEPGAFGGTYEDYVALLHPQDVERTLAVVALAVADRSSYNVEHRVIWPDGSVHWLQGRGKVMTDADGYASGTIGCISDVTDRKLVEANAVRRANEAEQAARTERRARERMEFLAGLNDIALLSPDHVELMRRAVEAAVPRLGDWCAVHFIPEPGIYEVQFAHADPQRVQWAKDLLARHPVDSKAAAAPPAAVRSRRTEFWPELDADKVRQLIKAAFGFEPDEVPSIVAELQLTSLISVPLVTKRGVVGAIQFVSAESQRRYDANDVALAAAAAGRIAEALDNAWLVEQQRQIAKTLQAALLPERLPDIPGVTIAARYWAAGAVSEVGGDFYDAFPIGPNRWALVIGDVCGTGPQAAAVTAVARHTIRAAAMHDADHTQVLNWVNEAILQGSSELFCTLLYSTLELLADGSWRYVSVAGGHPLPIVVGADSATSMIGSYGTLIGIMPQIWVTPTETILRRGSTLTLHTDGVNDVRPPHGLTDEELRTMVSEAAAIEGSADDVAERIGAAIAALDPIPDRDDDIAIVVVRIG